MNIVDVLLQKGLVSTRGEAMRKIRAADVLVNGRIADSTRDEVDSLDAVTLRARGDWFCPDCGKVGKPHKHVGPGRGA